MTVRLDARSYTTMSWVGVLALAVALVWLALQANWAGAGISLLFLVGTIIFLLVSHPVPALFNLLFVTAALINGAGWIWEFYQRVPGYDEGAHAFTMFAITLWFGFRVYYSVSIHFRGRGLLFVLVIATFGLAIGAVWEMIEYAFMANILDPVNDLIMDLIGAVLAALLAVWALNREPREELVHSE